ncbi:Fe-S cluster assembly ATPase SufC [Candidatus Peregrinibacteria bacterium]|nr:Fe-S cluster assembly ATPase SufC [Candidatus Peregrinibacteria bacterium]
MIHSTPVLYYSSILVAPTLSISGLCVSVDSTEILHGLDLEVNEGEVHAIMGPNGSGKSTLVNALMGHPKYTVTAGSVLFQGKNLLAMQPHERAQAGVFLAFQYPKEIAGVTLRSFLFAAHKAQSDARNPHGKISSPIKFKKFLEEEMASLCMDPSFVERAINKGFSGGEKKKAEILQLKILHPLLALLDETDSGLDVDALKIVAEGVNAMRKGPFSALVVTHYARILQYLQPDRVHVMVRGAIVETGGADLAHTLEKEGYAPYESKA